MAVLKIEGLELFLFLDKLSGDVDFDKDLPKNIYFAENLSFWFFERPLLDFHELFLGLISESLCSFESDVFIKFSGGEQLAGSCFSIGGSDAGKDACWITKGFEDFLKILLGVRLLYVMGDLIGLRMKAPTKSMALLL